MEDFKTIYIYENWCVVTYFLINGRFCLVSLGNPAFSNIFPRARNVLMTFELWTLCVRLCIFSLYISHLLLSSQQAPIAMWTLHYNKFTYLDYVFLLPSYILYIYIWGEKRKLVKSFEKKMAKICFLIYIPIILVTGSLALWIECSPMAWETMVQSEVASYQRLKKRHVT